MDLIDRLAHFGNLARPSPRTLLACRLRLLFKFVIALVRSLFEANGIRFFVVDGFFFQCSRGRESRDLFRRRSRAPIRMLGNDYDLVIFLNNFLDSLGCLRSHGSGSD